jgi:hypothetical protein
MAGTDYNVVVGRSVEPDGARDTVMLTLHLVCFLLSAGRPERTTFDDTLNCTVHWLTRTSRSFLRSLRLVRSP